VTASVHHKFNGIFLMIIVIEKVKSNSDTDKKCGYCTQMTLNNTRPFKFLCFFDIKLNGTDEKQNSTTNVSNTKQTTPMSNRMQININCLTDREPFLHCVLLHQHLHCAPATF